MIRTVLGDIKKSELGNTLIHEHIQCVSNDMLMAFGDKWLDTMDLERYSVSVLGKVKNQIGLSVFVDGTGVDLGRNTQLMKTVSEKTGVNIVASTGLYYYPSMLTCKRSAEDLAEIFIDECENGMDGTGIRPGILKCAADSDGITPDVEKRLSALAITQAKTGLALYAHCSHQDTLAEEMMELFKKYNAIPEKIIFGHASRRLDLDYLESILKHGCYVSIDQSWSGSEQEIAKVVYELCNRGYEKQILFSHDRPMYNDFERGDNVGLSMPEEDHVKRFSFVHDEVIPALRDIGCTDEQCLLFESENALCVLDI